MPITSVTRSHLGSELITVIDGKTYYVPDDPANYQRQMIDVWVASGNSIAVPSSTDQ
jgi:hypothetical protein